MLVLVLTLVIGATAAAIIVSQTAWFKNRLGLHGAKPGLNGTLSIERLGGNLFFGIEMETSACRWTAAVVAVKDLGSITACSNRRRGVGRFDSSRSTAIICVATAIPSLSRL